MPNTTPSIKTLKLHESIVSQSKLIMVEEIFKDISRQMLEINYILNLGHLLNMALELNTNLWKIMKPNKPQSIAKLVIEKTIPYVVLEVATTFVVVDNHMTIIHLQIRKNVIEDVLLDGGYGINIIIDKLTLRLGLPKPKLTPYNLKMLNQATTKSMGLIHDLKIYVYNIPYIITFIVLQNNVIDTSYSMLLRKPWLRDVRVAHVGKTTQ
jgi:hypothetical protein